MHNGGRINGSGKGRGAVRAGEEGAEVIISASRRTDIPQFHGEWMVNRVRAGFVDVRNAMFPTQVSRYSLDPHKVDGIVFWTKDPEPFLEKLRHFEAYPYYFQFTLTPYGRDLEPGLRDKGALVETFKQLSRRLGAVRVVWRFDPLLLNRRYTVDYLIEAFDALSAQLRGCTRRVVVSFIDDYAFGNRKVFQTVGSGGVPLEAQRRLATSFAEIARERGMVVETCAEIASLSKYGVEHGRCVDARLLEEIGGFKLSRRANRYEELGKDRSQRADCGCVESIDIGWPNTCQGRCAYCYATSGPAEVAKALSSCDPAGTLLCGAIDPASDRLTDHRGTGDPRDRSFRFGTCYGQESLL